MTLKHRIRNLERVSSVTSDPLTVFVTRFDEGPEHTTDYLFARVIWHSGKSIRVEPREGECNDEFEQRVTSMTSRASLGKFEGQRSRRLSERQAFHRDGADGVKQ
ncbi:MAG TPA: hypothetical protein DEO85_14955 [Maritimibacter sp.]|nr:hypothetical protein [Maritimibacter sp.]